ncbi:MAG: tRNA N6-adenosine threonylcarbamoyltransferase [Patescibacteria group bacterium]|nr:tRNA N6-adenosine threonylcarbamoyltransferase [Patescibacteria group bacterium]
MKILSIETSCDETAISLLSVVETGESVSFQVLANITHSQVELHQPYGGVFPALAKREHQKNLPLVLEEIMMGQEIPDCICVTSGPGLEPALWCGIVFAKELGEKWNIPVVPVNHMEGHILSVLVPQSGDANFEFKNSDIDFPALALLISGGHTELVLVKKIGDYQIIGKTRDDAVGEAFDKVARILGLPYPGGPEISRLAAIARQEHAFNRITFPRPMIHSADLDFSFSGIKTAVLYHVQGQTENRNVTDTVFKLSDEVKQDISREFENAVSDVLVSKTKKAVDAFGAQSLIIGGGVSANSHIKNEMKNMIENNFPDMKLLVPERELTGDNALMIGIAGYFKIKKDPTRVYSDIKAEGNLGL